MTDLVTLIIMVVSVFTTGLLIGSGIQAQSQKGNK
jgi:hypothetical protein